MEPELGHLVQGKRIAVVGGAMGGLAFALALRKLSVERGVHPLPSIQVFERDVSAAERADRGYSLSVRADPGSMGLQVLQRLGRLEDCLKHNEPGQGMHISRHNFRPLLQIRGGEVPGLPVPRIRITRANLRQALLDGMEPEMIHFSKTVVNAESLPGGTTRLSFEDGSSGVYDYVVVADGANSRIRRALLPDQQLHYTGYIAVAGKTPPLKPLPPELLQGQWLMMGPKGVGAFVAVMNQAQAIYSLSFAAPKTRSAELQAILNNPQTQKEFFDNELPKLVDGFVEPLPALIRATDPSSLWAIAANDLMPFANDLPGVVFIGDAWHAMSPFAGNGANMAMRDGLELAEELLNPAHASLANAQEAFSERAAPRSRDAIKDSHRNLGMVHSQGWRQLVTAALIWVTSRIIDIVLWVKGSQGLGTASMMRLFRAAQDGSGSTKRVA
uniref:Lipid body protein n=1 Tax=Lobosphaera incisa TaxID=312850 RepID=A0A1X9QDS8_9CHLO|nr:lipid body protein [Lobosphaera incisa]